MSKQKLFCFLYLIPVLVFSSENSDALSIFQGVTKAELHLHLGGAYPKEYLHTIATEQQKEDLDRSLTAVAQGIDYHDVFRVFQTVSQIVNSEEKVQKGVEALCEHLQEDGISYAELRTGLKNLGCGHEAYLTAVLQGIQELASERFQVKVLLSLQRNSTIEMARQTVNLGLKYRNEGVVGIDLSGDATVGQVESIIPELLRAKNAGLAIVVHLGESKQEKDQLLLLEALHPQRIGHGVHLTQEAKEWILKHKTPIEICLTSSVITKMIEQHADHPGLQFFRLEHPVAFCTDDPLIFSTTLSNEFLIAHEKTGLSIKEILQISQDAFKHRVVPFVRNTPG